MSSASFRALADAILATVRARPPAAPHRGADADDVDYCRLFLFRCPAPDKQTGALQWLASDLSPVFGTSAGVPKPSCGSERVIYDAEVVAAALERRDD